MNYKTLFAVASMTSVLFFSCQRESINEDNNASKATAQTTSELTKKINQRVNKRLSAASDAEMFDKFDAAKMVVSKNTKSALSSSTLSSEETPLEDIFYVYEGLFNNQFADYLANIEGMERVEMEVNLPVEIGENENYFVHNSILSDFYNNLADQISIEFLNDTKKILYFCDFSLKDLDREQLTANIAIGVSIGMQTNNEFFSPAGPYYACGALGPCNTNNPGNDAADFINVYANATADYKLNNPCPTGTNVYPVASVGFESYDALSWASYNDWFDNVYPHYWKGDSNDCLGNTNQEWQDLYAQFDALRDHAVYVTHNTLGHTDYEFIIAYYHSHTDPFSSNPPGMNYYHGGTIGLGKVFCQ